MTGRRSSPRRRVQAKRPRKKAKPQRRPLWRWIRRALIASVFMGIIGACTLLGGYLYYSQGLPDISSLDDYRPSETSVVLAADGTVIAEFYTQRRSLVRRKDLPDVLVQAIVSAEDGDFYSHEGLDYTGMLRAMYNSARAGRLTGSGSTITQQTVKNLLLTPAKRFKRKARELILARRLERSLTKDEILTIYCNAIYLGHGRYGVKEAVRYYWDKPLDEITLAEAATLAGLIQSPERLSPRKHPERAGQRRRYVLDQMVKNGFIDAAARDAADASPVEVAPLRSRSVPEARYFVDEVRARVIDRLGEARFKQGGLVVRTSLDLKRQAAAIAALRGGLTAIDTRQKTWKPVAHIKGAKGLRRWRAKREKRLKGKAPGLGAHVLGRVQSIEDRRIIFDLGIGKAAVRRAAFKRFSGIKKAARPKVGDVFQLAIREDGPMHPKTMNAVLTGPPQGALVVLDPVTRQVLAMTGGWDHTDYPYNRATRAKRQPGSVFKPLVWGAALASRKFTPSTMMLDAPETYRLGPGRWWKPKNYTRKFKGPVSLKTALAHSVNSIAVKLIHEVGVKPVQVFARKMGFVSPLADNLTLALGSSEVSPLELTNAYATLAADGRRARPQFIDAIEDQRGEPVGEPAQPNNLEQILDPAEVWQLRSVMRAVVTKGSGKTLRKFPRPVVGKTGTSNEARDVWFVGLLPDVVAVVWMGHDVPRSLGRKESGGRSAAPVIKAYLEQAERDGPGWPERPDEVLALRIDPESGALARPGQDGILEYYLAGTEPTQVALADDELDASTFMFEQMGEGPAVHVPSIPVVPLPERLSPLPERLSPRPDGRDDDEDEEDEDRP